MATSKEKRRQMRRRQRSYASRLMENTSLRDALNDEQATELLDWALEKLSTEAERTLDESEAKAAPELERITDCCERIMESINDLVGLKSKATTRTIKRSVDKLVDNLQSLRQKPVTKTQQKRADSLKDSVADDDKDKRFEKAMRVIGG